MLQHKKIRFIQFMNSKVVSNNSTILQVFGIIGSIPDSVYVSLFTTKYMHLFFSFGFE